MFAFDGLAIHGYDSFVSPYRMVEAPSVKGGAKRTSYVSNENADGSLPAQVPTRENVERKYKLLIFPRFSTAATNLCTNPRGISGTGWSASGTIGSGPTAETEEFIEGGQSLEVVTNGNANTGIRVAFTATAVAHSGAIMVKAPAGAPMRVMFDGETATTFTATGEWQLVKTENITLTAATRYLQVQQTDTGSRTFYVCPAIVVAGATVPTDDKGRSAIFHGSCGDAVWNGTPDASTSTCVTSADGALKAQGMLSIKCKRTDTLAHIGSSSRLAFRASGSTYMSFMDAVGGEISEANYDHKFAAHSVAEVELTLTCLPRGYRAERLLGTYYKAGGRPALPIDLTSEVGGDGMAAMRVEIENTSSNDFRYLLGGAQWMDSDTSQDLIVRAASFGTSGFSGTLTAATNEVQTFSRTGTPASGTFTVTLDGQTTSAIAYNASAATIQAALEALGNIGSGNVACTGGPIHTTNVVATFQNDLGGCNINLMTITDSVGGGDITCSATTAGVPGYVSAALYDEWTAICDSGAISLVGSYRLIAVVYDNSSTSDIGAVTLRVAKGVGDSQVVDVHSYRSTVAVGDYSIVDFGSVVIPRVPTGTQQWKVRVDGKTSGTEGSACRIVDLVFCPGETFDGEVRVNIPDDSVLIAKDDFSAISGAMNGDSADKGGTYTGGGDSDDFSAGGSGVRRTATGDTDSVYPTPDIGRRSLLAVSHTGVDAAIDVVPISTGTSGAGGDGSGSLHGMKLRYVDANNYVRVGIAAACNSFTGYRLEIVYIRLFVVIGGSVSSVVSSTGLAGYWELNDVKRVRCVIDALGQYRVYVNNVFALSGYNSYLVAGQTLGTGVSLGLYDEWVNTTAFTREYRNFSAGSLTSTDAAAYGGQSAEFRPDGSVQREIAAGSIYTEPKISTVAIPPTLGPYEPHGNANRLLLMASRFNPSLASHPYADPFTARIYGSPSFDAAGAYEE